MSTGMSRDERELGGVGEEEEEEINEMKKRKKLERGTPDDVDFGGLFLGCVEADLSKQIFISQHLFRICKLCIHLHRSNCRNASAKAHPWSSCTRCSNSAAGSNTSLSWPRSNFRSSKKLCTDFRRASLSGAGIRRNERNFDEFAGI